MRIILLIILLSACKTTNVQQVTYNIQAPEGQYSNTADRLSDFDTIANQRTYNIENILRSLPTPLQIISGKGPVVLGDSNSVAGRKVKAVEKKKTRNVENETSWLMWIGIAGVVAILVYFLIRR